MVLSQRAVNPFPLGKEWGFKSLPLHHAGIPELAQGPALEAGI